MEKEPSVEDIESRIEQLLEEEYEILGRYIEMHGEIQEGSELDEREYWVVQEARTGRDREHAEQRLREFIDFLKQEIEK